MENNYNNISNKLPQHSTMVTSILNVQTMTIFSKPTIVNFCQKLAYKLKVNCTFTLTRKFLSILTAKGWEYLDGSELSSGNKFFGYEVCRIYVPEPTVNPF